MKGIFVETTSFTKVFQDYFGGDESYQELQVYLLENPDAGDVMRGCGGIRKIRWRDVRRGKGKRGGLRVIYLHVPEYGRFLMLDVYDKGEADDLSAFERREMARLAGDYREQLNQKKGRKRG